LTQLLLNVLNVLNTPMDPINDSRIGSFHFLNQSLVNEFGYCCGDSSGFVLYPLVQQPPLDDPFKSIASIGIVGEIGENVITSLTLFSGKIASHLCPSTIVYAFTVQLKIIDGFGVIQLSTRGILPT
jgi:hypothetical protein